MATKIEVNGETITVGKAFVSGKDRITINGQVVFEGKLESGVPRLCRLGSRRYDIELRKTGGMTGSTCVHLTMYNEDELVHQGVYDPFGKAVGSQEEARANVAVQVCTTVGGVAGFVMMMALNKATGVVPGGAIGGGIGGGLGAVIGLGVGKLLFGRPGA